MFCFLNNYNLSSRNKHKKNNPVFLFKLNTSKQLLVFHKQMLHYFKTKEKHQKHVANKKKNKLKLHLSLTLNKKETT